MYYMESKGSYIGVFYLCLCPEFSVGHVAIFAFNIQVLKF